MRKRCRRSYYYRFLAHKSQLPEETKLKVKKLSRLYSLAQFAGDQVHHALAIMLQSVVNGKSWEDQRKGIPLMHQNYLSLLNTSYYTGKEVLLAGEKAQIAEIYNGTLDEQRWLYVRNVFPDMLNRAIDICQKADWLTITPDSRVEFNIRGSIQTSKRIRAVSLDLAVFNEEEVTVIDWKSLPRPLDDKDRGQMQGYLHYIRQTYKTPINEMRGFVVNVSTGEILKVPYDHWWGVSTTFNRQESQNPSLESASLLIDSYAPTDNNEACECCPFYTLCDGPSSKIPPVPQEKDDDILSISARPLVSLADKLQLL